MFERQAKPGGLLRYGIPDFKMEKHHIDRRVKQMEAEGVVFHCGVNVGVDKSFASLHNEFDAVLFAGGAEDPRNPNLPGQDLAGVHYAMPYLTQSNQRMGSEEVTDDADPRERQACGGDRRRRHGVRLRRHGLPPGRAFGDPARHSSEARPSARTS